MRNILRLTSQDGTVVKVINLDLLAMAYPVDAEPGQEGQVGTVLLFQGGHIRIPTEFSVFLETMEKSITESFRVDLENSARWHNKRMEDTKRIMECIMEETMKGIHQ